MIPFAFALPEQTTILREPAAELSQRLATYFLREAEQSNDLVAYINAAIWLNNLANRLSDLGRREEALTAAEEAVRLYRALAEARPDAFIPDLALSLNTLAAMLSALGRREEALTAAEEAVRLYRALAEARSDAFIPDLAGSLWVLGDPYGEIEKPDVAIATLAEAIQLLTPTFVEFPAAVVAIMAGMLQSYLSQCAAVSREPDTELLGPALAVFESLTPKEERG